MAWDPANAFIATASNDRTVRVFRNPAALQALPAGGKAKGGAKRDRAAAAVAADEAALPRAPASSVSGDAQDWPLVHCIKSRDMPLPAAAGAGASTGAVAAGASGAAASEAAAAASASDGGEGGAGAVKAPAAPTAAASKPRSSHGLFLDESVPTFFRRLAWSPDGTLLFTPAGLFKTAAPAAAAGGALTFEQRPTTYAFARDHFVTPLCHYPGSHQGKPSIAVRCSPVLYRLRAPAVAAAAAAAAAAGATASASGSSGAPAVADAAAPAAVEALAAPPPAPSSALTPSTVAASLSAAHTNLAFALPYRILTAIATLDAVHVYDSQLALPVATIAGFHVDKITDIAWCALRAVASRRRSLHVRGARRHFLISHRPLPAPQVSVWHHALRRLLRRLHLLRRLFGG